MWLVYEILLAIAFLCYVPKALMKRRLPHRRWSMRLGRYPQHVRTRVEGRDVIWIHAVSVGEVMAVQPLIWELRAREPAILVVLSTITPTGFAVASNCLGTQGVVIYAPLDFRFAVRRALETIRPRLLLLVESELWPALTRLTNAQRIPVAVVNGRISARAYRRYRWVKPWLKRMLDAVDLFLMQSEEDAARITGMGAEGRRVRVQGSLKWDASLATRPKRGAGEELAARLGVRPDEIVLVAGSTHRGEETTVLEACRVLRKRRTAVRLVIAPRHVERIGEVEALVREQGLSVQRASAITPASGPWDVAVVDTFGTLPAYYGIATVAFIGGSLIPHGGQNPLEAASLGKPVIFGPSMENFAEIAGQLLSHEAAIQLRHRSDFVSTLKDLLDNPAKALAMGQRARDLVEHLSGTSRRTCDALKPLLTDHPSPT